MTLPTPTSWSTSTPAGRITGWMPTVKSVGELTVGEAVQFVPSYKPGVQFAKVSALG